ncbi:MAG: rRNA maturation RNase YbeY [Candidatus Eisenbacteria bacterium]
MRSRDLLPIDNRVRRIRIDRGGLRRLVDRCLTDEGVEPGSGQGLVRCGDRLMRRLNRTRRGLDRTTDVLSFPSGDAVPGVGDPILGEVVISIPRCRLQAREQGVELGVELVRLVVHGALHVLGYDHERAADRARMVPRERVHRGWARRHGLGAGLCLVTADRAGSRRSAGSGRSR